MNIKQIIALDEQYYMKTFGKRFPVAFDHGEGSTLVDTEGRKYLDFLGGIAVNALGYGHKEFTAAIVAQAQKLLHTSSLFYIENQARLAQLIVENSCADRVFIANSGAEANEGAVKLARKFFFARGAHKYKVITALDSFHGRTLAMVSATGQPKYQKPYQPIPQGFVNVPYNDIQAIREAADEQTCAVMLEVIQGESGVIEADEDYLRQVRFFCDERGLLLIFDEVQTGMGRTGKLFSYQHSGVEPDIFTLAKALGNGLPIGAIVAKARACAFEPGDHGSTFGGNPICCAAGVAVMKIMTQTDLIETAARAGAYFKEKLTGLKNKYPALIVDVRGRGLLLGMQICADIAGKELVARALEKGFIINCAGHNTLRFAPPLIITKPEIDSLIQTLDEMLSGKE